MFSIISALIYNIAFSFIEIIYKNLRSKGVSSFGVLAIGFCCVPIWIILGFWLSSDFISSVTYWVALGVWLIVVYLSNLLSKYLYGYKSLTELKSYSLGLSLVLGLIVDILYFRLSIRLITVLAALLLLTGGILLSHNHSSRKNKSIKWSVVLIILLTNSIFQVIAISAYKVGISLQENIIFQVILTQSLLYSLFFMTGFSSLKTNTVSRQITIKHILGVFSLLLIGTFFEAYTVKSFPITILAVLSVIPTIIFSCYDLKCKELTISKESIIAIILVFIGLILSQTT